VRLGLAPTAAGLLSESVEGISQRSIGARTSRPVPEICRFNYEIAYAVCLETLWKVLGEAARVRWLSTLAGMITSASIQELLSSHTAPRCHFSEHRPQNPDVQLAPLHRSARWWGQKLGPYWPRGYFWLQKFCARKTFLPFSPTRPLDSASHCAHNRTGILSAPARVVIDGICDLETRRGSHHVAIKSCSSMLLLLGHKPYCLSGVRGTEHPSVLQMIVSQVLSEPPS